MAFVMKQNPESEKENTKHRFSETAGLPKDVVKGLPIMTMLGWEELCIENYRGIIEYTEELIRIQTKNGQIRVCGKRMEIESYTNDEMVVKGEILSLECKK